MKKVLLFIGIIFICGTAFAETKNITWRSNGSTYSTSTCEVGNDLIIPQNNPTKYGYHFVGWEMPDYIFLDYIESTGTQRIETTYIPPFTDTSKTVHITTEFEITVFSSNWAPVVSNFNDNYYYVILPYGTNKDIAVVYGYSTNGSNIVQTEEKLGKIKIETISQNKQYTVKANDIIVDTKTCSGGAASTTDPIQLSNNSSSKIYSFSISVDDVLMENLIPAKRRNDNAIGMYDTVTGTFFENSGRGTFIAGPVKQ